MQVEAVSLNKNMDQEIKQQLEEQDKKLDAIYQTSEKIRKYFLLTFWVTVVTFIIPLIALTFVIPYFLNSYLGSFKGLLN